MVLGEIRWKVRRMWLKYALWNSQTITQIIIKITEKYLYLKAAILSLSGNNRDYWMFLRIHTFILVFERILYHLGRHRLERTITEILEPR